MIRSTGVFLDTRHLTAMFVVKYGDRMQDGLLHLRDIGDDGEAADMPILKEWKSARGFLARFKAASAPLLNGQAAVFGKVWIESLPGQFGTPWTREEDDYAQSVIRTRTALIVTPDCYSFSGLDRVQLGVGVVNIVEHRILCSETNPAPHSRVHLIVDVKRPDPDAEEG